MEDQFEHALRMGFLLTNTASEAQRSDAVQQWLRGGCGDPLVLWPSETATYPGAEITIPDNLFASAALFMPPVVRPIRLYRFDQIKFTSDGGSINRDGPAFQNNIVPSYADRLTSDERFAGSLAQEAGNEVESAFILLHNTYGTYGHFLLEMAPKLVVYRYLLDAIPDLPILLSYFTPQYILRWIDLLVPGNRKVHIQNSSHLKVRSAFCSDMLIDHYALGTAFREFLRLTMMRAPESGFLPYEKIFISRRIRRNGAPDFRYWTNEKDVERALTSRGFTALAPETLPITSQINIFRNAKIVVGELSSALHNAIFCKANTWIVQINPFNRVQTLLSLSLGHRLTSIGNDSGKLAGWPACDGEQTFSVDVMNVLDAVDHTELTAAM